MLFSDYIEKTNRAKTPADVFGIFLETAVKFGVDRAVYADVSNFPTTEVDPTTFVLNYPDDWANYYYAEKFDEIDPVTKYAFVAPRAFMWDDLSDRAVLSEREALCLELGREAGLNNGVCVPLHGPMGRHSNMSLASSIPNAEIQQHLDLLALMAMQFQIAYGRLVEETIADRQQVSLTNREREVIGWCYRGKSSWVIGELLKISEDSVNFHIKNAMRKLNCSSRMMCVLKAIRLGLIIP